jgi:hypothetical protein
LLTQALKTLPPSLLPTRHLPALLVSLRTSLSALISTFSSSSAYLSWPDVAHTISYENVYNHLHLLDTYLLGQWSKPSALDNEGEEDDAQSEEKERGGNTKNTHESEVAEARDEWLADALVALSVCAENDGGTSAQKCSEILFRVLVSLTHGDEMWGRKVVENECALPFVARAILHSGERMGRGARFEGGNRNANVKKEDEREAVDQRLDEEQLEEDGETQALDRLCLALGLLTNLVQVVEGTKDLLRDICTSCLVFFIDTTLIIL